MIRLFRRFSKRFLSGEEVSGAFNLECLTGEDLVHTASLCQCYGVEVIKVKMLRMNFFTVFVCFSGFSDERLGILEVVTCFIFDI